MPIRNDIASELQPKSFYKRAVRHNMNASSAQNKLQRKFSRPKLATSREYKVQERVSQLSIILILIFDALSYILLGNLMYNI